MRKHLWLTIVIAAIIAAAINIFIFFDDIVALLGSLDEERTREWISALSGWAALAVGFPTLVMMWLQNRDTERRHYQSLRYQALATVTFCLFFEQQIRNTHEHLLAIANKWKNGPPNDLPTVLATARSDLEEVQLIFDHEGFTRIHTMIGPLYVDPRTTVELIKETRSTIGVGIRSREETIEAVTSILETSIAISSRAHSLLVAYLGAVSTNLRLPVSADALRPL